MAVGANSSNGNIGSGEAQVYGTSPAVNMYAQFIARQNAKREREQQILAQELSQVKTDGLREEDRKGFFDKYQEIKNLAAQVPYEKNSWKRAQQKADVDQQLLELGNYVNNSKMYRDQYKDIQTKFLDNRIRDQYTDDAIDQVSASARLPMNDPKFIRDFNGLARQVDGEKMEKVLSTIEKAQLAKSQWGTPIQTKGSQGNKSGVMFYNKREVAPEEQMAGYLNLYSGDPTFRKYVRDQYPDLYNQNDENTAKALAIKDFADKRRAMGTLSETTAPQFKPDWRDKEPSWLQSYYMRQFGTPFKPATEKTTDPTYFQDLSERMRTGVAGSGEEFSKQLSSNPAYLRGLKINAADPKNIVIEVPAKWKDKRDDDGKIQRLKEKEGYRVTLDSTDPNQWHSSFARIYRDVTGDGTAVPSKAMTESGKGKVPGGMRNPDQAGKPKTVTDKSMVTVVLPNGQAGQIPANQVDAFLKKYPKAKKQ